jgi:hypothetical protein
MSAGWVKLVAALGALSTRERLHDVDLAAGVDGIAQLLTIGHQSVIDKDHYMLSHAPSLVQHITAQLRLPGKDLLERLLHGSAGDFHSLARQVFTQMRREGDAGHRQTLTKEREQERTAARRPNRSAALAKNYCSALPRGSPQPDRTDRESVRLGLSRRLSSGDPRCLRRFDGSDEAVAVKVPQFKLDRLAEKLTAGDVAVAIAIHCQEPSRTDPQTAIVPDERSRPPMADDGPQLSRKSDGVKPPFDQATSSFQAIAGRTQLPP